MSLLKCEAPDDPKPEKYLETKNKIMKLETIRVIGNSGFPMINQNILFCLDHKSQMAFRSVCQSWKEQVHQPFIWIRKLNLKSYPIELGNVWIDLVGRIQKGSDLENEVTECLMKWYGKHQSYDYIPNEWTPLHIAAKFDSTKIFKFLAPQVENPNAPAPNGLTPHQIATNNNHSEIVETLSQMLAK